MIHEKIDYEDAFGPAWTTYFCIIIVHTAIAGPFVLLAGGADIGGSFGPARTFLLYSLLVVPVAASLLLALAHMTRRCDAILALRALALLAVDLDLVIASSYMLAQGVKASAATTSLQLRATIASHVLLGVLLEWKTVPVVWQRLIDSGMYDLSAAIYDPRIAASAPASARPLLWQVPLALGPAAGVFMANALRASAGMNNELLIAGSIVLPGTLLLTYAAWVSAASILLRVIRWEIRNGATLRLPRPIPQEVPGGSEK
jgi:hypothetical protein